MFARSDAIVFESTSTVPVVVIGAGPAGLTAALELAELGVPVQVVEANKRVGGLAQTVEYKGFRFDIGGHRFFTKVPAVRALWRSMLGDDFLTRPRLSRILFDGKFFDYPLKPADALFNLGIFRSIAILASYLRVKVRPIEPEISFEDWVTNRFGRKLFRLFFKTYTEKVWGIPCTEIRAEWAAQRIQNLSLEKAILSAASLNRRSTKIKTLISEFKYPRLGPGQMWEMCRDRIEEMGNRVLMGHKVSGIDLHDGRVVGVRAESAAGEQYFPADHVISTTAVRSLVRALSPEPPPSVLAAANGLRYRDFVAVALILGREKMFPDNWIYIHTPGVQVGRIQNFNNWSQAMVPVPGKTCLGLEYFCFKGDGLWESSDPDLIAQAVRELEVLNIARARDVEDGAVIRMPKAYPIYDAMYREHLDNIRDFIDPIPNLHTVGRNGMHKYNNQDHSMLTAMMALWNMAGASHDLWAVNTDFEYHEEQRLDEKPAVVARAGV